MSLGPSRRIDGRQVRALVRAYLIMSLRTMPLRNLRSERSSSGQSSLIFILGLYVLLGALLGMAGTAAKDVFTYSFMLHTLTLFVVGTSAMNEASEVLFLSKENDILLHRPIHPATLVLAKAVTILTFSALLALAINLIPSIVLLHIEGVHAWVPLAHLLSVAFATIFACASVVCLYGLMARALGRERIQRVVTTAQIASTVFLAIGFQIVPRLIEGQFAAGFSQFLQTSTLAWFLPPAWFAGLDAWLASVASDARQGTLALVGLGVTAFVAWLGILRLPTTSVNVATLHEEPRAEIAPTGAGDSASTDWIERLLGPWLRDPIERASFRLTRAYLVRERTIRVRVASSLAVFAMFPVLALVSSRDSHELMVVLFWLLWTIPFTVVEALRYSTHPAAADLFLYSPVHSGAALFHGVRKAAIVFVQLPAIVYTALVSAWILRAEPSLLLMAIPALIALPAFSLVPGLSGEYLPLALSARTGQGSARGLLIFFAMIPAGMMGLLTFFALKNDFFWIVVAIELPLAVAAYFVLLRLVARNSMRRVESVANALG